MARICGLPYSAAMTDSSAPDALARRYLDLWEEQMAAWASDAALADVLRLWMGLIGLDRFGAGSRADGPPGRSGKDGEEAAPAAPPADAPGDRQHDLAEFARHRAALEQRLAALEARAPVADAGAGRRPRGRRAKGVRGGARKRN